MSSDKYRINDRGSRSVTVLEKAWTEIQRIHSHVPRVVVTIMGSPRSRLRLGYIHAQQWRYLPGKGRKPEVAVNPLSLDHADSALAILVHEAAHSLFLDKQPFLGCSRDGYYHRKEFRDVARGLGLRCEFWNNRYGWSNTGWKDGVIPIVYDPVLSILRDLPKGTGSWIVREPGPRKLPDSGHIRLTCRCKGKRSVYVAVSILRRGGIMCKFCRKEFRRDI